MIRIKTQMLASSYMPSLSFNGVKIDVKCVHGNERVYAECHIVFMNFCKVKCNIHNTQP